MSDFSIVGAISAVDPSGLGLAAAGERRYVDVERPMEPTRWLRLRHPSGFSDEMFECFRAGCSLWDSYVQTSIRERSRLGARDGAPHYVCLDPELSTDRLVASLPLAAQSTIGSRAHYEDSASYLLREFFTFEFTRELEEGLTEDIGDGRGLQTNWRSPMKILQRVAAQEQPYPSHKAE